MLVEEVSTPVKMTLGHSPIFITYPETDIYCVGESLCLVGAQGGTSAKEKARGIRRAVINEI